MIMKKQIISWGMMLAAAFTLTNCAKEIEGPAQESETKGYPFEIVASAVSTKTVNDGMATKWEENDKINLFHVEAGGTADYQNDKAFTVADVDAGRFTGELSSPLEAEKKYDWYAIYPYSSNITTPGEREAGYTYIGHRNGLNQSGYNSTAALAGTICPFYGVAKAVDANTTPSIDMKHLSSVVAINVTNTTNTPVTITTASLTATEDIVGSYYIDITGSSVTYNPSEGYVEKTATVNVSGGTALAEGESAILYLAIKPFTAAEGTNLMLSVNGLEKTLELPNDVEFSAGKIKTLNFNYDVENVEVPAISVADFMELVDGPKVYELTGRITRIKDAYSTQFNNIAFYLKDSTGEVLIYRMSCVGIDNPANTITVGDEITVRGSKTTYSSAAQMAQGGVYVSHRDGCATPVISCSENMVTITSEDGAKVYYTTDDTDPTTSSTPYTAPFAITETNTVKAIAVADGKLTSLVAEETCQYINPSGPQPLTVTFDFTSADELTALGVTLPEVSAGTQITDLTKADVTFVAEGGSTKTRVYNSNGKYDLRAYKGATLTFSVPDGHVINDVLLAGGEVASISKSTLPGNPVVLTVAANASTQKISTITVTYVSGEGETPTIQPRNLAFSAATATATVGQPFTAPTLNGVTTGVTYTSSNESVATVNAETGAVTLVGAGTTTITASAPANAEYEAGEASYTLTVSAAEQGGGEPDEPVENHVAVINVASINAIKAMGNNSYGDYKDKDVSITVDGLPCVAKNICANGKDGNANVKMAAQQFIQVKGSTGYIYNTSGKVKSIKVWTLPVKDKKDFMYIGSSSAPTTKVTLTPTTETVQLKDNNDTAVATQLNVYEVNLGDNNSCFNIKSSGTLWIYKLEVVYQAN